MGINSSEIGRKGEDIAVAFLRERNYKILFRNWRTPRWGEVDIIAIDGRDLVFLEVKTRSTLHSGEPLEAVNFYKLRSLKRAALYFKELNPKTPELLRIDVLSIVIGSGDPNIQHFRSVYEDTLN